MHQLERFKYSTPATAAAAIAAALITAACGGSDTSGATTSTKASKRPPVRTLSVASPCGWLTTSEVEQVLGKLTALSVVRRNPRSRSTEDVEYDARKRCHLYERGF